MAEDALGLREHAFRPPGRASGRAKGPVVHTGEVYCSSTCSREPEGTDVARLVTVQITEGDRKGPLQGGSCTCSFPEVTLG